MSMDWDDEGRRALYTALERVEALRVAVEDLAIHVDAVLDEIKTDDSSYEIQKFSGLRRRIAAITTEMNRAFRADSEYTLRDDPSGHLPRARKE